METIFRWRKEYCYIFEYNLGRFKPGEFIFKYTTVFLSSPEEGHQLWWPTSNGERNTVVYLNII